MHHRSGCTLEDGSLMELQRHSALFFSLPPPQMKKAKQNKEPGKKAI